MCRERREEELEVRQADLADGFQLLRRQTEQAIRQTGDSERLIAWISECFEKRKERSGFGRGEDVRSAVPDAWNAEIQQGFFHFYAGRLASNEHGDIALVNWNGRVFVVRDDTIRLVDEPMDFTCDGERGHTFRFRIFSGV